MRRISALAFALLLAGCSSQVAQTPAPVPTPSPPAPGGEIGQLIGKTSSDLIARFGSPALRIQEGSGLKLQFRGSECVLDAYLYPSSRGMRVTHVDTRYSSGVDFNQAACIVSLTEPTLVKPN